jgi:hypothetical protein
MRTLLATSALCLFLAGGLFAQNTSITGTVTDPSGSVVPSAALTLVSLETGAERAVVSDAQGRYDIPQVPAGKYKLIAKASGFAEAVINDLELLVGQPATIEVKFVKVGSTSETVQVEAAAAVINTTDASLGNAIDSNAIIQQPSYARNVVSMLAFQPGVTSFSTNGNIGSNDGAVNGGKPDQSYITLDGADVGDQNARTAFTSVLRVTLDSVEEFRTSTTNYDAANGRGSGANVQMVTKSGTNGFHGAAYEYRRGTETAANSFFNNLAGTPRPFLLINTFGVALGGPIKKNKLFYFGNWEGLRNASSGSTTRTVPTASLRQGIVTYLNPAGQPVQLSPAQVQQVDPGGIGADPAALKDLSSEPLPNNTTAGDLYNTQGYTFNYPAKAVQNTYIGKIDYHPDDKNTLFVRGNLQNDWSNTAAPEFPGQPPSSVNLANNKGLAAGWTSVISAHLVSTLHYGFTRPGVQSSGVLDSNYEWFRNISTPYATSTSQTRIVPTHNIGEDLSWVHGAHTFGFGGGFRNISNRSASTANSFSSASSNPSWLNGSGNDLVNGITVSSGFKQSYEYAMAAVLGLEAQGTADYNYLVNGTVLPFAQPALRDFVNRETEAYAQDTWKATQHLTITLGVRMGLEPPVHEINGQQASTNIPLAAWLGERNSFAEQGLSQQNAGLIQFQPLSQGTAMYPFHKNFAPRLGIAWSPSGQSGLSKFLFGGPGKSSLRAGAGMYYDLIGQPLAQTFSNTTPGLSTSFSNPANILNSAQVPRYTGFYNVPSVLVPPAPQGGLPLIYPYQAGAVGSFAITNSIDSQLAAPYTENYDLTYGREFGSGFFLQVSYVGRFSKHSLVNRDLAMPTNPTDPQNGQTYFQAMTQMQQYIDLEGYTPQTMPQIPFFNYFWSTAAGNGMTGSQVVANDYLNNSAAGDATNTLNNIDNASNCVNGGPSTFKSSGAVRSVACSIYGPWMVFNPQFSALSTWSSIGKGNYNGLQVSLSKRLSFGLQFGLNYTWSKSEDLGSSQEGAGSFSGFIENTWNPSQMYAVSNYDTTQQINVQGVYELPVGRGRRFGSDMNKVLNAVVGGWQLASNYRQTSALPFSVSNGQRWPTDWNVDAYATPTVTVPMSPTNNAIGIVGGGPNVWTNPLSLVSGPNEPRGQAGDWIETFAGQSGLRNNYRGFGFFNIDTGLYKVFRMPFNESHQLQFRWETFNITNTPVFANPGPSDFATSTFGKVTGTLNQPRQMQFALRYTW